nr:hypothetical protein [uncultured Brevundimonas sp.]
MFNLNYFAVPLLSAIAFALMPMYWAIIYNILPPSERDIVNNEYSNFYFVLKYNRTIKIFGFILVWAGVNMLRYDFGVIGVLICVLSILLGAALYIVAALWRNWAR